MIHGIVVTDLTPTINLTLIGVDQREKAIRVAIDTGFTGELSLPIGLIRSLGWPFHHDEIVRLADGSRRNTGIYRGIIVWNGEFRIVSVLAAESSPLLGSSVLRSYRLTVDFQRGGFVSITDIPKSEPTKLRPLTKPIIGLIGGIGSGKSAAAAAFVRHGGCIISADAFGHEALQQPDIRARVVARWGERVVDSAGNVDRKKLGGIVFASPVERTNLELLVFPWIERRIKEEIAKAHTDPQTPFVVLDAAIMLEAGWNNVCDKLVYIDAPRDVRLERVRTQRGWSAEEVANREMAQLPLSVKASRADAVVDNSGSLENTQEQVDALAKTWGLI